jgi:hypothetical protein
MSIPEIKTEFLFTLAVEVEVANLGDTPYGSRRVGRFGPGNFEGPMLKATVVPGGTCWMLMRRDDVLEIDGRIILETDDKQLIYMTWKALRRGPKEVIDRLNRGDAIDPETYYFRATPYFDTGSEKYSWMNRICSIAAGSRKPGSRTFDVFRCCRAAPPEAFGARSKSLECRLLALLGPREMSDLSPQSVPKRTSDQVAVTDRDFMSTRPRLTGPGAAQRRASRVRAGYF